MKMNEIIIKILKKHVMVYHKDFITSKLSYHKFTQVYKDEENKLLTRSKMQS